MDDLDRLAFRLVRTIRQRFPHLQSGGFTFTDLEEHLLSHKESRREMADGSTEAWEGTMLRLLAGERGYLVVDADMQQACQRVLASPSPTLALVRTLATSPLALGHAALNVGAERISGNQGVVPPTPPATPVTRSGEVPATRCGCRYCGGRLPNGQHVVFCPHCGLDLTKRQCPACSTELEVSWRFCVTCGRNAELPDPVIETPSRVLKAS